MTDLMRFIDTYKQVGIDLKTYVEGNKICIILGGDEDFSNKSRYLGGYTGFYSKIVFNAYGEFLIQEFYE